MKAGIRLDRAASDCFWITGGERPTAVIKKTKSLDLNGRYLLPKKTFSVIGARSAVRPVLPLGSSKVKVFPTAFLGPLPALLAGRKSPAHGRVPPLRAGSAKSAAVPGVLVPSEETSTEALR